MAASFGPFKPKVRFYWDSTYFYEESDGVPDRTLAPNLMVGITSWQQHFPLFTSYFASTTNPENDAASLGFGQPNVWKLPLVPVPSASPIPLTGGNFQRGAVAIAANGIPIFNPRNNTGQFSYAIGELDQYGGHCGKADDYHYHIAPVFLQSILGTNKPVAWALDGYPIYGYTEPDGTPQQPLDADGGHTNVTGSYHYHAIGSAATGPQNPYLMNALHGTVVNYGGQVDGQPEAGSLRQTNSYFQDQPVPGVSITAFMNPVALTNDGLGNLVIDSNGVASPDQYLMRTFKNGTNYDICWQINRNVNPKTMKVTWRLPTITPSTTNYNNANNRLTTYMMAAWSENKLPDTGQSLTNGSTLGQDADYSVNIPAYTDNGNGTISDKITGLIWQKLDNGESTWETAVANTTNNTTGGYADWRLPTPVELFSIQNHNNNKPAMDMIYFPTNPVGGADYLWTSDLYGSDTNYIWCANNGGGLGPKQKWETLSATVTLLNCTTASGSTNVTCASTANLVAGAVLLGTNLAANTTVYQVRNGTSIYINQPATNSGSALTLTAHGPSRYHARYVRGAKPTNGHNYLNNGDGTITDLDTGLMWQQVPSASTNWYAAITNAENLSLGGYTDWRLPNVKELQTLTDYTLATATSTSGILPCLNRVLFSSAPATAYWTSTLVKAQTLTQAWLIEFGINNSVPASNGPIRNKQGIISYEIFSSSYPSFAVRGPDQSFVMAIPARTNNAVQLTWAAVPGRTYTLYHSPTLNAVTWTNLGSIRCNGTTGSFADTNSVRVSQGVGFYRASYVP